MSMPMAATPVPAGVTKTAFVCPDVPRASKHFTLTVTKYNLTLPDGRKLPQLAYNRSVVGPAIVLNLGDEVSIDLRNELGNTATSTHWHGLYLPNASWADGVAGISQAPVAPGGTFRYRFRAEPAGTFWYHAHTRLQYADGLRGPLIVRDPNDPYKGAYDEERLLMVYDQADGGMAMSPDASCGDGVDYSDTPFYTLLANGKGFARDPKTGKALGTPEVITVKRGRRYRFRTIQGSASWAIKTMMQGHGMDIIALDGYPVQRTPARGFVATPGERVDFILQADQPVGNYWIQLATLTGGASPAILHYEGAPNPLADPKLGAPALRLGCAWGRPAPGVLDFKLTTLPPLRVAQPAQRAAAQHVVYLADKSAGGVQSMEAALGARRRPFNLTAGARPGARCSSKYCWSLNWLTWAPSAPAPLVALPAGAPLGPDAYVQDVAFGATVDIAFINLSPMTHPMHIHGQGMWLLGTGNGDMLKPDGSIDYAKLRAPRGALPKRDTVPVPNAVGAAAAGGAMPMGGGMPAPAAPAAAGAPRAGSPAISAGGGPAMAPAMGTMPAGADAIGPPKASAMPGMPGDASAGAMAPAMDPAPEPTMVMPGMPGMSGRRLKQAMQGMAMGAAQASPAAPPPRGAAQAEAPPMQQMGGQAAGSAPGSGMGSRAMAAAPPPMGGSPQMQPANSAAVRAGYGYTVVRIVADNPGVWALHCHIDAHAQSGMIMALRVAGPDPRAPWAVPGNLQCTKR